MKDRSLRVEFKDAMRANDIDAAMTYATKNPRAVEARLIEMENSGRPASLETIDALHSQMQLQGLS